MNVGVCHGEHTEIKGQFSHELVLPFKLAQPLTEEFQPGRTKKSPCLNAGGGLLAYFT